MLISASFFKQISKGIFKEGEAFPEETEKQSELTLLKARQLGGEVSERVLIICQRMKFFRAWMIQSVCNWLIK